MTANPAKHSATTILNRAPRPLAWDKMGLIMAADRDPKSIRFEADDPMLISKALAGFGIEHKFDDSGIRGVPPVITAYYSTPGQAEKLVFYLIDRTSWPDKIEWQQDRAHREIEGWCELCEFANGDECDGGCLINYRSEKQSNCLFVRSARESASPPLPRPVKSR